MLYPFTIDTEVTVSYIQNDQFEDEKKASPNVYTLNPRTWLMSHALFIEELNNALIIDKLNSIIKVYYGMMVERIKGYVKPEDKDSLFIRRLDEKSLEFVINDKVNAGDTDDGKRTFLDICNHFDLLLEVLSRHRELNVVKYSDVSNNEPVSLDTVDTICRIIDRHVCNSYHISYDPDSNESGKRATIGIYHNLLVEHSRYQRYQNHFVGGNDEIKDEDVFYYYADKVDNPVKVNNVGYARSGLMRDLTGGGDIINSVYSELEPRLIRSIVTHISEIVVDTVIYLDGDTANTVETGLQDRFNQYNVFEYWANNDVVITKFIEKVVEECTVSTVATDCETLCPDVPFTLEPDTLYSFNVNTSILRIIEHELLRLNLPYVCIRSEDNEELQYLIISNGIKRHLDYLRTNYQLDTDESVLIQIEELYQGSLDDPLRVQGYGVLINPVYKDELAKILYGILKGVYV